MTTATEPCYLCHAYIGSDVTEDHVLPKQFIKRSQPRMRGFEYAGKLPTHAKCNNDFKDERFCQSALSLLDVMYSADSPLKFTHRSNPEIEFLAFTPNQVPGFGPAELEYFGFIDAMENQADDFKDIEFFEGKPKVNLLRKASNIALSVIAKSACAFLLRKGSIKLPPHWRILMVPLIDPSQGLDIQELFGPLKPYEEGLYVWSGPTETGDGSVVFRHGGLIIFILVTTSRNRLFWNKVADLSEPGGRYLFNGKRLIDLVGYDWSRRAF